MMTDTKIKSGQFLLRTPDLEEFFVPEKLAEEEKSFSETVGRYSREKILPKRAEVDAMTEGLIPQLLRGLGELGTFMLDVPEALGGVGASKKAAMQVAEWMGASGATGVAAIAQAGIGGLPIIYFGTDEQREKYLPGIMSAEIITAYALTEPGSGSDALSARTTATWNEEKQVYVLSGAKQFITNAGFADIFISFAQVDGDKFTCFILEKSMPGLSTGAEEKKMGFTGSSTRSVILENVEVPKENVLGEIGKGHRIAFNVLNIGRLKLAPATLGGAKISLREGATYARDRKQFGKSIAEFGVIQQKLAIAASKTYCAESMCYRTAHVIDRFADDLADGATDPADPTVQALKEFAVECSINKVYATEALDYVVDEMLQVHGGYGYIQEYPIESIYRDSRINRIWEGTSEINRMIVTGTLLQRAMKGELPLMAEIQKLTSELMERRGRTEPTDGTLGPEQDSISLAKKMTLFAAGVAAQKFLMTLDQQQEVLSWLADMVIQVYAMESALLRTLKLESELGADELAARIAAVELAVADGFHLCEESGRSVLAASHKGEELRSSLSLFRKLTRRDPIDRVAAGRTLARFVVEREGYPFG